MEPSYPKPVTYECDSAYHHITVTDDTGVRMLRFERNQQSSMLLDDVFETTIEYCGYLHLALALKPDARRMLALGLGGGTVVKRFWRDYPQMRIDAAELDPEVARIAREYFALPDDERIRVFVGDGRAFLSASVGTYDIVIIDAFDDDRVPRQLLTEEFMREVRDHLAPDGVIAYNFIGSLYGTHSKGLRSLHRTLGNVWRRIWLFPLGFAENPGEETRNIVVLATDESISAEKLLERIESRVDGRVSVPGFERFGENLYRGAIRRGDVPLIVDEPGGRQRRGGGASRRR
jgi:spermidine synthase